MPKLSKPVMWAIVALAGTVIWYLMPTQDTPTASRSARTAKIASKSDGISQADLDAHFPRYTGGKRNPFIPGVVNEAPGSQGSDSIAGGKSDWALTGINSINGDQTACIENSATSESVFLKKGQTWNGLKVVKIADSGVLFEDPLGQQTTLGFKAPAAEKNTASADQNAPTVAGVEPLPPLPSFGGYGSQRPYAVLRRRMRNRDYSEGQNDQ